MSNHTRSPLSEKDAVQLIYILSWVPVIVLGFLLAWQQPYYWRHWFILVGIAAVTLYGLRYKLRRGWHWFLILAALNFILLTPELYLRVIRFFYTTGVQFGYPGSFQGLRRDPDLFWTLPLDEAGVNSWGFRGPEVAQRDGLDSCRLLILGDSVPAQGFAQKLAEHLPEVEIIDLSLAGYSSYQGRVLIDKYGDWIAPDIVLISYGWNDHWLAYQSIDSQKIMPIPTWVQQAYEAIYHQLRSLQWARSQLEPLLGADTPLAEVRVPYAEYVDNLTIMGEFFASRGATPVFITAPSAHSVIGVHDYLVERHYAPTKEQIIQWHRAYNEGVRQLTAVHNWPLLDLEAELAMDQQLADLFMLDGIHLTERGLDQVGQRLVTFMDETELFADKQARCR